MIGDQGSTRRLVQGMPHATKKAVASKKAKTMEHTE
jgi:hypothetical protein